MPSTPTSASAAGRWWIRINGVRIEKMADVVRAFETSTNAYDVIEFMQAAASSSASNHAEARARQRRHPQDLRRSAATGSYESISRLIPCCWFGRHCCTALAAGRTQLPLRPVWEKSVVQVEVSRKVYDYYQPWNRRNDRSMKIGLVVGERQILTTCAGPVRPHPGPRAKGGRGKWTNAKVEWVDYHANLALLTIEDDVLLDRAPARRTCPGSSRRGCNVCKSCAGAKANWRIARRNSPSLPSGKAN